MNERDYEYVHIYQEQKLAEASKRRLVAEARQARPPLSAVVFDTIQAHLFGPGETGCCQRNALGLCRPVAC